jgi:propanol-preferring alcohol dehydrogenase
MVLDRSADIDESPLVMREVDDPHPAAGEVRISVTVCAVCRTDLHVIEGDLPAEKRPVIPGHQVVGVVDELGEGCSRLREGDRVGIAWLRHTDGTCQFCRSSRENLCPDSRYTGYHADGGYGEFATVPEAFAYSLPHEFDDVTGSPLLCAGLIGYRALKRAQVPDAGKLLLVGFGSSAHVVLQIARYRGYETFVVTRSANHVRMAKQMGADWAGSDMADIPTKVDSAILFAPTGRLVPPVMEALDRGGTLSIAGIHLSDVPPLNYEQHLFYDKEIRSVAANTREDGQELLAEAVDAGVVPHVTTYPLAEANKALQDMKHSRVEGTGVLVIGGEGKGEGPDL